MYLAFKHLHMTLAILSLIFFITRWVWSLRASALINRKWVKVTPHIIDTLLLLLGISLLVQIQVLPWQVSWLSAKLVALVFYIGLGVMALKSVDARTKLATGVLAIGSFAFMLGCAITKSPMPWLA